ncbi:hypothetical protein [Gemmatimonas aurantiaca]|uniref:hypothetical protein n=1 Tax=Gemmatimonas aurantiaca TaxID=173480 RepID=UPI00301CC4C0
MSPALSPQTVARIQAIVSSHRVQGAPWSTGVPQLDRALGGGIPRGRITEVTGPLAVGKSALMHRLVRQVLSTGSWVAWIDASRTLAPAPWAGLGERFVVIRLPAPRRTAWTADLLLRSGVFGLVVIDGAPPLSRIHGVRLTQLARERDAACVVIDHLVPGVPRSPRLTGTMRLRIALQGAPRQGAAMAGPLTGTLAGTLAGTLTAPRMQVTVEKGGLITGKRLAIEVDRVDVPFNMAHRLCAHPEVPDRRGVAHSTRRPWVPRDIDHTEHRYATTVSGGGIGVVTHDLYGIGVSGPTHFAVDQRRADERRIAESRLAESRLTESRLTESRRAVEDAPDIASAIDTPDTSNERDPSVSLTSTLG